MVFCYGSPSRLIYHFQLFYSLGSTKRPCFLYSHLPQRIMKKDTSSFSSLSSQLPTNQTIHTKESKNCLYAARHLAINQVSGLTGIHKYLLNKLQHIQSCKRSLLTCPLSSISGLSLPSCFHTFTNLPIQNTTYLITGASSNVPILQFL